MVRTCPTWMLSLLHEAYQAATVSQLQVGALDQSVAGRLALLPYRSLKATGGLLLQEANLAGTQQAKKLAVL